MSDQPNSTPPSRVATPAHLAQRLQSFRVGEDDRQTFVLRDKVKGKSYDLEPWQFFVLEVLPGCKDEQTLQGVFEDRFGRKLLRAERDELLASLADAKLLNEAATKHPLLERFFRKTYQVDGESATAVSQRSKVASANAGVAAATAATPPGTGNAKVDADETLVAGMQDAIDFDPRATRWMLVLFDPTLLLRLFTPLLAPLRHLLLVLPLVAVGALMLAARNAQPLYAELVLMLEGFDLIEHWVISLVTVNLAVVCTTAMLAHRFRATVSAFGIVLLLGIYPRFGTRIGHLAQLSRVERMWLHGAPLLLRLAIFSAGMFVWFGSKGFYVEVSRFALAVSFTAAFSLLFTANPLIKSNGYHLLSAFTDEPHLRGKAFKTLLNKARGRGFKQANELLLATYAAATAAFMFLLVVGGVAFVLNRVELGGSTMIIGVIVGFIILRRVLSYFARVEQAYDRALQFDRWRSRTLGEDRAGIIEGKPPRGFASYAWKAGLLTLAVLMFLPYEYRAGGQFVVYPPLQQGITTDVSGRIETVYFDGGETLAKGTVIAQLATHEDEAQVEILDQKMAEQQAVIDDFALYPRPQDVDVAETALTVARTRVKFSRLSFTRVKRLLGDEVVSQQEYDEAERQLSVDLDQVKRRRAELEVAKLGPTEFEVAEAEAKLRTLAAQREVHLDRIRRSQLTMPFDGRLLSLRLREKGNSYYRSGDVFAQVEALGQMTAEIELPESEAGHVGVGSTVQLKAVAYSSETFAATVVHIDWDVTEEKFGNVLKVIAQVDDDHDGKLRNGMTGFAKVDGPSLLVWEAFSKELVRFFEVQVWSWIP